MTTPVRQIDWQDKTIPTITGGINKEARSDLIEDNQLTESDGVAVDAAILAIDKGYQTFAQTVVGEPRASFQFFKTTGAEELILVTNSTFYTYNTTVNKWELVSNGTSTTLSANEAAGQTILSVTDETGFTVGELAGIRLDDGNQHQATVTATSAGTITIDVGLPSAAASGNVVLEGVSLNGSFDEHTSLVVLPSQNWLIFTNNIDNIKKYDGSTCQDLGGLTDTTARFLGVFKDHLLLFATNEGGTDFPQRVRWSDTADFENFTTGNAGFQDLLDSEDFIMQATPLGPHFIIYRDRSIARMEWVGTATRLFNFDYVVYGEGPVSSESVIDLGDYHVFFGNANIYEYRGGFDINPLGDRIYPMVFAQNGELNPGRQDRVFSLYVEELDELWFFYPTSASDFPNKLLRYKLTEEAWYTRQFAHDFLGYGFYRTSTTKRWLDLQGSWLDQDFTWNSVRFLANAPVTLLCARSPLQVYNYDYAAGNDAGTAISYVVETKDFTQPGYWFRVDSLRLKLAGSAIEIAYSLDEGSSWTIIETVSPGSVLIPIAVHINVVTERIRWRLRGSGGGFRLGWVGMRWALESPEL